MLGKPEVLGAPDKCRTCDGKGVVPTGHVHDTAPCTGCAGTGTHALAELMAAARELAHVESCTYALTPEGILDRYTEHCRAVRGAFERVEREVSIMMREQAGARTSGLADILRDGEAQGKLDVPGPKRRLYDAQVAIAYECQAIQKILLEKNQAYGNSALDPVRVFSKAAADEQIRVRLDDKLSRISRGEAAGEDVTLDLIGYLVLLRVYKRIASVDGGP